MTAWKRVEQMIFDKVCKHLAQQKRRSLTEDRILCAYRGSNGLKCAVGALLPNHLYHPELEGDSVYILCYNTGWLQQYASLLEDLQQAHDSSLSVRVLIKNLVRIAKKYELNYASVKQIQEWEN